MMVAPALAPITAGTLAPSRVLRIHGMRRSGNHALIDWIMRNAPGGGAGLFLNNCKPGRNPLRSARGKAVYAGGVETKPTDKAVRAAGEAPFTVVSFEDHAPPQDRTPLFGAPEMLVVIYRSFLNWSASLLRKIQGNPGYGVLDRAKVMANALPTYHRMLSHVVAGDVTPLCYDDWTADESYRAGALKRLDLPGTDLSKGEVQRYGGGSSFQGKAATPDALTTDQRAAQMSADPEYQMLLWTAARDIDFMQTLAEVFPADATRLSILLDTASADIRLPDTTA
ncbi:MAG: hypothetical protein AAFY38_08435 [Pseudomonadota bacterium]